MMKNYGFHCLETVNQQGFKKNKNQKKNLSLVTLQKNQKLQEKPEAGFREEASKKTRKASRKTKEGFKKN